MILRPCLTVIGLVLLAGCGSAAQGSSRPADTVRRYHAAIAAGDGTKACEQLDGSARKQLQDATQGAVRGSCKQVIDLLSAFWDGATKDALKGAPVSVGKRAGDAATATFTAPPGLGGTPREQHYELRREGGDWKIHKLDLSRD